MIVRNEAGRLATCLESVRKLVDEMVVVDTGSTDGTPNLARSKGAKVFDFPWRDDFSAARNESLRRCTGDWVLILDADETIDALDHSRLRDVLGQEQVPAFRLVLRNYLPGGGTTVQGVAMQANRSAYAEGAQYSHFADGKAVRLCRRYGDLVFEGRIHELLEPYFLARRLPVQDLEAVIHHFGKADLAREAAKKDYYLELAQREAQARPQELQAHFNLLQQAMAAQAWPLVEAAAFAALKLSDAENVHPLVWLGAGMALQANGRHTEALPHLERLLALEPRHAQGLARRAVSLAAVGRLEEAREALRAAIAAEPGFIVPYVNLAELESQGGNPLAAQAALAAGLAANPADPQLLHAQVQLALSQGDLDRAVQAAWAAIQACPGGGQGVWHRLVAFQLLQKGLSAQAVEVLDLGLRTFPENEDLLRLRKLAQPPSSI